MQHLRYIFSSTNINIYIFPFKNNFQSLRYAFKQLNAKILQSQF